MFRNIIRASTNFALRTPVVRSAAPVRYMADHPHQVAHIILPIDPHFQDEEVIAVYNPSTKEVEPVIVAVIENSLEFVFSSPIDLHTFDVIPIVKDCINPADAVKHYEAQ